tara:strand:- start:1458 stop:1661 length:204 start_codon:yes stop_codon:yes gene_type:complete
MKAKEKLTKINYKEIAMCRYNNQYQVTCFDTERRETTYMQWFKTITQAQKCFDELIQIQAEKMNYQL